MALSRIVYTGDGVTNQYAIPFSLGYIREADVTCRVGDEVDGLGDPLYRELEFLSPTLVEIQGDVPEDGVQIVFDRSVSRDQLIVDFEDGDIMHEGNLNTAQKQAIMLVQEVLDGRISELQQDLDMNGFQIKDLGVPTYPADATNKQYVDEVVAAAASGMPVASIGAVASDWIAEFDRSTYNRIDVSRFLLDPENGVANTALLQEMVDDINSSWRNAGRSGAIVFPPGILYKLSPSQEAGNLYNGDTVVAKDTGCLLMKSGVTVSGHGRYAGGGIRSDDRTRTLVYLVEPEYCVIKGIEIGNVWQQGLSGAGHGLFSVKTQAGNDTGAVTNRIQYEDLYVHNVASYGLSTQNGRPQGMTISNVDIDTTGADGCDLKGRFETDITSQQNVASNVRIRNHGLRVTGSSGIDIRGAWQVDNLSVTDFGNVSGFSFVGIRFRTKNVDNGYEDRDGSKSHINNLFVDGSKSVVGASTYGIESGSDDISADSCYISDVDYGVNLTGNAEGVARRNSLSNIHVQRAKQYSFLIGTGMERTTLVSCSSQGALVGAIRNIGYNTTIVAFQSDGDAAKISTAGLAAPTEQIIGGNLLAGNVGAKLVGLSDRVGFQAFGDATDIDYQFENKGAGITRVIQGTDGGATASTPGNFTATHYWKVRMNGTNMFIPMRTAAW